MQTLCAFGVVVTRRCNWTLTKRHKGVDYIRFSMDMVNPTNLSYSSRMLCALPVWLSVE
jgi:hypothetical protein